jgi:antitoxin PrlF
MSTGTMTSKGQITIPADVRRALGLRPGSRVAFVQRGDGVFELRRETGSVRSLRGVVPGRERPVSLEEMDDAISSGATGAIIA